MQKPVKVCHLTSAHQWNDIRIFVKECSSLARNGFDVSLVAANCPSQTVNNVNIVGVQIQAKSRLHRMRQVAKAVYEAARQLDADIYHFHDPELLRYVKRIQRAGKKVIYDSHEDVPRQILGKFWINKYLRKTVSVVFERYENRIARKANAIVAATPHIRERFFKLNKNTVDICNYPVLGENQAETQWSEKRNEVCYVGGITEMRGILELVEALPHTKAKLNLAGDFSPASLQQKLEQMPGWKQVNYLGFVGRDEIYRTMAASKIGIVTLRPAINYLDSLPIKMFEYMSAGIPVIASDFPLWKEIVESTGCGICVDPLDPEKIARAIEEILSDDRRAEEMGRNGRHAAIAKYNWSIEEKKLVQLYTNLSVQK